MKRAGAVLLLAAWTIALASAHGGCAVVLDASSELGDTCRFDGDEDTTCGMCVASACQAEVDACCADAACAPSLSVLDGCSDGNEDDCDLLFESDGEAEALGACMARSCAGSCAVGDSVTWCYGSGTSCSCSYDASDGLANDDPCTSATVGGGLCCGDIGYPDVGLECRCENFSCRATADGCSCSSGTEGPMSECTGTFCCADSYGCSCGEAPCEESETRVESCSIALYTCGPDEVQLDACSAVE